MATDVVAVLDGWHREHRRLLAALADTPRLDSWPAGEDVRHAIGLVRELQHRFVGEEAAKERHLWPAIGDRLPDGPAVVDRLREDKKAGEDLLLKMSWADDRSPAMAELVDAMTALVRAHLDAEDRLLSQLATWEIPLRERIGQRMVATAAHAPHRPYPNLPAGPTAAAVLGPVVAAVDHLRGLLAAQPTGD